MDAQRWSLAVRLSENSCLDALVGPPYAWQEEDVGVVERGGVPGKVAAAETLEVRPMRAQQVMSVVH